MSHSKKNIRKLGKFAGRSFIAILGIFIVLIGTGLVKNLLGVYCVGFMGSGDCVSDVIFSPFVFIGLPISLILIGAIEILYISKESKNP
jgi:hypothetical protein